MNVWLTNAMRSPLVDDLPSAADPGPVELPPVWDELSSESGVAPVPKTGRFDLKLYLWLLAAALVGTLAILPYSYTLMKQADPPIVPESILAVLLAASVIVELLISAVAIALGLALGPRVGLGMMSDPDGSVAAQFTVVRLWQTIGLPLVIGMGLGVVVWVFTAKVDFFAEGQQPKIEMPSPGEGLLASIGAGIREEIWLRLGFMTLLVWLGANLVRLFTTTGSEVSPTIVWVGNLLAALCFAAIHLPQAMALLGRLTAPLLAFIFVGNGVPGLVFGWLYWRRGLYAAMLTHFGLDLVTKVFVPLIS
jgi:hypothetical protein